MIRRATILILTGLAISGCVACQPESQPRTMAAATEPGRSKAASKDFDCPSGNDAYETSGCRCKTDAECTCRFYDGEKFANRAEQSRCLESGRCVQCLYD